MTTPSERLLRAVYTAAAVYDDAVSLHATDADWPGLRGHSGPLKVYSTTRRTHVATRSGATIFLEDPPGQPATSPVLKFPDRRRV